MFFRRVKPRIPTFEERLQSLEQSGFAVERLDADRVRVTRAGCAAVVRNSPEGPRIVEKPGLIVGSEIGVLVDAGFQKQFLTPSGRRVPALAEQLKAIHAFSEDLREALGLVSLYNESLGTTSTVYLYDRVQDRDRGVPKRPWE
jgi:hypothetical protein